MRKTLLTAAVAALAVAGVTTGAHAAITVSPPNEANNLFGPLSHGQVMLYDFDSIADPNVAFTGNVVLSTNFEDPISTSAPPPYTGPTPAPAYTHDGSTLIAVDPTNYASVQGGGTSTFSVLSGYLTSFSFYMGSPDSYNRVTFNLVGGGSQVFQGEQIWGGSPQGNGDRTVGYRVYYDFNGAKVSSITFQSSQNAFEFDGLAGTAVPEPATWALMIMGFGGAGAMLRSRRRAVA
jgi:hypothetical protein